MERLPVFVSEHEGGTSKHREQSKAASLCKEATFRSLIRMEEYQLCKFAKVWNSQSSGLACQQVCVTLLPKDGVGEWGGGTDHPKGFRCLFLWARMGWQQHALMLFFATKHSQSVSV